MASIVVFGGTVEGRKIAEAFSNTALILHICVATEYGASLLPKSKNIILHIGRMDGEEMKQFLETFSAELCLDLTHPYATKVTQHILEACHQVGLPYLRVQRQEEERSQVLTVESVEAGAVFLNQTKGNILVTTGSKELEHYTQIHEYQERCFVRVLPMIGVLEKCKKLCFLESHVIGMQGPFTEELNYALLKQIDAAWLVTKSSGKEGGYQEKWEAALRAGVSILVIERPRERREEEIGTSEVPRTDSTTMDLSQVLTLLETKYLPKQKRKAILIGMGPGHLNLLTREVTEQLEQCDVLIGAKRVLDSYLRRKEKPHYCSYQKEEILSFLQEHEEYKTVGILYSGDIGFYSGAKGMKALLGEYEVSVMTGISSPLYFLNKLGISWDEVKMVSNHGRKTNLVSLIREERNVCTLLGEETVNQFCEKLLEYGMEHIKITIGERLSYREERVVTGTPRELLGQKFDPLSIALFENPTPSSKRVGFGICDQEFLRGKVPMTKQEIRTLSLTKLGLAKDSVLYDVGAGTGSVSIEAALQCEAGIVYAIEKKPEAVQLILANKRKFQVDNLEVLHGQAPDCLEGLPIPTHVFIGGSGKKMIEIIHAVREKNKQVVFVINAVTLETMGQIEQIKIRFPEYEKMEVIQVQVAKSKPLGEYHTLSCENPVFIICFGGREEA